MRETRQILAAYLQLIQEGKRPNFLFLGSGTPDAAQFSAFALFARDVGIALTGIVYDCAPANRPHRFDERHILGIGSDDFVLLRGAQEDVSSGKGFLHTFAQMLRGCFVRGSVSGKNGDVLSVEDLRSLETPFFFIYPASGCIPPYALEFLSSIDNDNIVHIVLEEGIGSYLMTLRDWWFLGVSRERSQGAKLCKSLILHALWPIVKRQQNAANRTMTTVLFTLFTKSDGIVRKNPIPCEYCARAFDALSESLGVPAMDYSNTAIIATTRFAEHGASEYEMNCLRVVVPLLERYGYRVVLRPHPSERDTGHYKSLTVEIDECMHLPLESLVAHAKVPPSILLGFMSSSQLTANALWNIAAVCLADVLKEEWDRLAKENSAIGLLDREIRDAKSLFGGFVEFPCGVAQFEEAITLARQ